MGDIHNETRTIGHIVLITSPFFGHMIPLLDFARRLSQYHHVTYIVSASKLDLLKQHGFIGENESENSDLTQSKLKIIGLLDRNDDDYEVTNTGTNIEIPSILNRMREPLVELLFPTSISVSSILDPIDMIISDLFVLPSIWEIYQRNMMIYLFVPNSLKAFLHYINTSMYKIKTYSSGFDFDRQIHAAVSLAKGLICNSIFELDEQVLKQIRQQSVPGSNLPILFVAPLMSDDLGQNQKNNIIVAYIKQWLDTQWEKANRSPSVIYVSFGSWTRLQSKQVVEIAHALKKYPFIWSLKTKLRVYIPSAWIDNQRNLLFDWVPQRLILSHPAIRLFISHGGWNSLLESMSAGKPTLVWPLFGDQMMNGDRIEHELGMGRRMRNTDINNYQRIVPSDEFAQYFEEMFTQETEYIRKARQVQQILIRARENSSRLYFEEIIKAVDNQINTRTEKHNEL